MYNAPEQVTEFNKSALNAALQLAKISLDTTERLVGLNLEASKETFADASDALRTLNDVRDPQALLDLRTKLTEKGVEQFTALSRSLYDVGAHAQSQISALFEAHVADWNQSVAKNIDQAIKAAPAGADVAIAAVKSTVAATAAAFDGVTKTAKQVASFADASVKATVDAASAALKPAA
ncbi:MAG: phasin family protein [Betaproteobacteria bacterium]|nr:TIGR01841 family phasin [Betaproteobacteria bacterium]MDE2624145.1 phasin family protein [Betaproteobacteria bacterium]